MPSPSISRRRIRRNSIPSRSVSLFSSSESSSSPSRSSVVDRPPTCPVRRGRSDRTRNFKAAAASVPCSRICRNSIPSRSSVVDVDRPPTRPVRGGRRDRTGNFKAVAASVA